MPHHFRYQVDDVSFDDPLVMFRAVPLRNFLAKGSSLKSLSLTPMENVGMRESDTRAMMAAIVLESIPPLRNAPDAHVTEQVHFHRLDEQIV